MLSICGEMCYSSVNSVDIFRKEINIMKKKLMTVLLAVALTASICGCSKNDGENVGDTESTEAESLSSAGIEYDPLDYVELGEYKGIEVQLQEDYTVDDAAVQTFIEQNVLAQYPDYKDTDKKTVETGDFVNIDYVGKRDGVAFNGGTAAGYVLEIGSGSFIPGFEDGLIGVEVGNTVDLPLTFPETYNPNPDMAGAEVVFTVTVNKIVEKQDITYENMTDEYVKSVAAQSGMPYETVEDMRSDARAYLEAVNASQRASAARSGVLAKLTEVCKVRGLPEGLLDARMEEVLAQYTRMYCQNGETLQEFVTAQGQKYEEFVDSVTQEVEADLESQIVMEAIAAKEEIAFDQSGFDEYVSRLMSSYGYEDENSLYENYGLSAEGGKAYLQKVYVCDQALQMVVDEANLITPQDNGGEEAASDGTESAGNTEAE